MLSVLCDESCHLEHDDCIVMVLGALWCPKDKKQKEYENWLKTTEGAEKNPTPS